MKSREKLILGILSLVIAFSMVANTSAVVVGDSEVGVAKGDILEWDYKVTILGVSVSTNYTIVIDWVNSTGGNLVITGDIIVNGTAMVTDADLTTWNETTGNYDSEALGTLAIIPFGILIAPKLNLTVVATELNTIAGYTAAVASGSTITATHTAVTVTMKYNSDGIMTKSSISIAGLAMTMTLKGAGGGGVSFGYAVFLIVPVAVIAILIKKRKSTKLL